MGWRAVRHVAYAIAVGCKLLLLLAAPGQAIDFTHVSHTPHAIDPARGEVVTIRFRLTEPAPVALEIYDGRNLQVQRIELGVLDRGEHSATWNGRNGDGALVPPEAYAYTLEASPSSGPSGRWDVTDSTGGETLVPQDVRWDPETGKLSYRLESDARVRIRIGLQASGPLLHTPIDWVARARGAHEEPWDGRDASDVLDLSRHPRLDIFAEAFSLPRNTVLVGPPAGEVRLLDLPPDTPRRTQRSRPPHRILDFASQPLEVRRDFSARLVPAVEVARTAEGDPIVRGPLPLRLSVDDAQLATVLGERCEAVFFVDGQFVFEREVGFLPMTWTWVPTGLAAGEHYITANIRGYEGHFGITTLRVVIDPETGS
jgi:hypothetical protein